MTDTEKMLAEISRLQTIANVLQRLSDEDGIVHNTLRTQNTALLEALKDLKRQQEHPDAFWDWSKARAAIALAEGEDV